MDEIKATGLVKKLGPGINTPHSDDKLSPPIPPNADTASTNESQKTTSEPNLKSNPRPGSTKRPVVPRKGVKTVFLWTNTHGGHHAVSVGIEQDTKAVEGERKMKPKPIDPGKIVCDICRKPHLKKSVSHDHSSLKTREWFMLMPHRTPNKSLYQHVSTAGHVMDFDADPHLPSPLQRFYWQHVFQVVHDIQVCDPGRIFICLYQFCTAGGHLKWMQNPAMQMFHRIHKWPVFMMATAKEQQYSLGFSFTQIFLNLVSEQLSARAATSKDGVEMTSPGTPARDLATNSDSVKSTPDMDGEGKGTKKKKEMGEATLEEVYDAAVARYWSTHEVELGHNARASSPSMRYGEIQSVAGKDSHVTALRVRDIFVTDVEKTC